MKNPNAVTTAVRLPVGPDDPPDYAFRLIAFALEHDADVIVLSALDYSGL